MELKYFLSFAVIATVIVTTRLSAEASRVKLRPLSASEVYTILKAVGREDAVPEGRVVTQGLAAVTGFGLGVTTGVGGALLFDLATSNATSEFINSLNMTALTELFSKGGISTNTTSNGTSFLTQEICFQSSSLASDDQGRNVKKDENDKNARQINTSTSPTINTTPPTTSTPSTPTTTGIIPTTGTTTTGTGAPSGTTSTIPTYTPVTGTGTSTSASPPISSFSPTPSVGTGTATNTATQTGTENSETCIVTQKPKARKRRSSHHKLP